MQRRTVDRPALRWGTFAADLACGAAAIWAAREIRVHLSLPLTESLLPPTNFRISWQSLAITLGLQIGVLSLFGAYSARIRVGPFLGRLILSVQSAQLAGFATLLYLVEYRAFPRSVLLIYLVLDGGFLYLSRAALRRAAASGQRRKILLVGDPGPTAMLGEAIRRHPWTRVDLAGTVDFSRLGDIPRLLEETGCEDVLLAAEQGMPWDDAIEDLVRGGAARLWVLPSPYETLIGRLRFQPFGELPLLEVRTTSPRGIPAAAKRALDIVVSGFGLVLASPLFLVQAAAAGLTGAPSLYGQTRVGRDGKSFRLWKFRTMQPGAESETGAVLASRDDPRVTPTGRFLRAARIDEIPQLWNVLRGEMSLVGPRPERPEFVSRYTREIGGYGLRLAVRPGLTGLAQVSGEYETDPRIKLRYDLAYINNWSLALDLILMARTLPVILTRRGV
jgi:exopolysaccharide biosynthesis polyprenyl glycosylphosphotransferase